MATLSTRQITRGLDLSLLTITTILIVLGLAALFSFSLNVDHPSYALLWKQLLFAVVGGGIAWWIIRIDYRALAGIHWVLYGMVVMMLVGVLIFGQTIHGTTGWFDLGGWQLQPVEFAKILMAIFFAKFFSEHADDLHRWRTIGLSGLAAAGPVGLVILQPDLGSAVILVALWLGLLIMVPVPRRYLAVIGLGLVIVGAVAWVGFLKPYQKDRIFNVLAPGRDRLGTGYNVEQAITAVGSGELTGRGLGLGPQSQLNFLPERQTDFIFASISEELGFLGASFILALFALFFWRLSKLVAQARDNFSVLLAMGLAIIFFTQVAINIAMNVGFFPVTGIPLPFISYGGSSLVASLIAIGILESIAVRQRVTPL